MPADLAALLVAAHDRIHAEVIDPLEAETDRLRAETERSRRVVYQLKAAALDLGLPRRCSP